MGIIEKGVSYMRYVYSEEELEISRKIEPYLLGKFSYKKGTPPELIKEWEASVREREKKINYLMTMPITYNNKTEK